MISNNPTEAIVAILRQIPDPSHRGGALIDAAHAFGFACAVFTDVEVGDAEVDRLEEEMIEAGSQYLEGV